MTPGNTGSALDLLLDIELPVTLRFGRTQMTLSEVIDLNRGSVIDFVSGLQGAGFKVENPNVVAACGCGSSFRVADEEQVSAV